MLADADSRTPRTDEDPEDLSLVLGGPLYQAMRKLHLVQPPLRLVTRRVLFVLALVWLPLFVLSAIDGNLLAGNLPFLHDLAAQSRFFVAGPLFVYAEQTVHERMRGVMRTFRERGLIGPETLEPFRAAITFILRLRNSIVLELGLVVLVFTIGHRISTSAFGTGSSSWWMQAGGELTTAGWWYAHISLPVVQFLLLRWLYRLLLWSLLMGRVSRLDLALVPTHPDRAGGLGFLSEVSKGFAPLAVGMSVMVAGVAANRILYGQATLESMKVEIGAYVVFAMALVLVPLCVFAPLLTRTKRAGRKAYGALAMRYTREFDAKWARGSMPEGEALLGSADIQSLADLGTGYAAVTEMRAVPFGLDMVKTLAWPVVAPLLPLVLTVLPLEELLRKVAGLLL